MIYFLPCQPEHIQLIDVQDGQKSEWTFNYAQASDMVRNSICLSAWNNEFCVGAGGLRMIWPGRAAAWLLLGKNVKPALPAIVRRLRGVLAGYPANRVEMTAREDFGPGCHLAALLGFEREARLLRFFPDGSTAQLFARIRP